MTEDIIQLTADETVPTVRTFVTTAVDLVIATNYGVAEFVDGQFSTSDGNMVDEVLPCEGVREVTE